MPYLTLLNLCDILVYLILLFCLLIFVFGFLIGILVILGFLV